VLRIYAVLLTTLLLSVFSRFYYPTTPCRFACEPLPRPACLMAAVFPWTSYAIEQLATRSTPQLSSLSKLCHKWANQCCLEWLRSSSALGQLAGGLHTHHCVELHCIDCNSRQLQ
jgi:hypothetical protein